MKKTILLIEDKKNIRETLKDSLEHKGYKIEQAINGAEGLKKLKKLKVDMVVTDTSMPPGMNGYQVCNEIKKVRKLPIKVIIYTATYEIIDPLKAREAGADEFIVKGTDPTELFKAITKLMK